jgi:hypothetical protein
MLLQRYATLNAAAAVLQAAAHLFYIQRRFEPAIAAAAPNHQSLPTDVLHATARLVH